MKVIEAVKVGVRVGELVDVRVDVVSGSLRSASLIMVRRVVTVNGMFGKSNNGIAGAAWKIPLTVTITRSPSSIADSATGHEPIEVVPGPWSYVIVTLPVVTCPGLPNCTAAARIPAQSK